MLHSLKTKFYGDIMRCYTRHFSETEYYNVIGNLLSAIKPALFIAKFKR